MYIIKQWVTYTPSEIDQEDGEEYVYDASFALNIKCIVARSEYENLQKLVGKDAMFATVSYGRNPMNGCGDADSDLFHLKYTTHDIELFRRFGGNIEACENSYELHWLPFVATEKDLADKGLVRDKIGELPRPKPVFA